jgi:kinesin family protein 14
MAFATPRRVNVSSANKTPSINRLKDENLPSHKKQLTTKNLVNNNNYNSNPKDNLITVAVRVRPLDSKEHAGGCYNAIRINDITKEITVNDRTNKPLTFTCDHIITNQANKDDSNQYVYESIGKPLLDKAFDGFNVSIFAYGQTGSGKTYSMIGTQDQPGLIPRFFDELFQKKSNREKVISSTHIEISYYEIYNEKIYDLLRSNNSNESTKSSTSNGSVNTNGRNLQIRENPQTGPFIVDLLTLSADSASDAKLWLDIGNKRRATACTNMNQKSSRSHSVFQITLTQMVEHSSTNNANSTNTTSTPVITGQNTSNQNEKKILQLVTSKINLVDLAGSERINTSFNNNSNNNNPNNNQNQNGTTQNASNNNQLTSSRFKVKCLYFLIV